MYEKDRCFGKISLISMAWSNKENFYPPLIALLMGCFMYTCNLTGLCQVFFIGLYPFILLGRERYQEIVTLANVQTSSDEGLMLKTSASVKPAIIAVLYLLVST